MIIIMHPEATPFEIDNVVAEVEAKGWQTHLSQDSGQTVIGLQGLGQLIDPFYLGQLPGVEDTVAITQKFKLASRAFRPEDTTFTIGGVTVGASRLVPTVRVRFFPSAMMSSMVLNLLSVLTNTIAGSASTRRK